MSAWRDIEVEMIGRVMFGGLPPEARLCLATDVRMLTVVAERRLRENLGKAKAAAGEERDLKIAATK